MAGSRRKIFALLALGFSGLLMFGTLHSAMAQSPPTSCSPDSCFSPPPGCGSDPCPTDTPPQGTPRPTQPPQGGGSGGSNPDSGDGGDQLATPAAPAAGTGAAPTPEVIVMDPPADAGRRDAGSAGAGSGLDGSASATPGPSTTAVP